MFARRRYAARRTVEQRFHSAFATQLYFCNASVGENTCGTAVCARPFREHRFAFYEFFSIVFRRQIVCSARRFCALGRRAAIISHG